VSHPSVSESGTDVSQVWRDPSRPAAERAEDLLGQMTLEEKAAQLTSIWIGTESTKE